MPPKRCFKCQKLDSHEARQCKSPHHVCVFCAGHHKSELCFAQIKNRVRITLKCANCGGAHKASDKDCPAVKKTAGPAKPTAPQKAPVPPLLTLAPETTPVNVPSAPKIKFQARTYAESITLQHHPANTLSGEYRNFITFLSSSIPKFPNCVNEMIDLARKAVGPAGVELLLMEAYSYQKNFPSK